jgi:hypothetical protein
MIKGAGKGRVEKEERSEHPPLCPFYVPNVQGILNPEQYQILLLETLRK